MKSIYFDGENFIGQKTETKEEIIQEYIEFIVELDKKFDFYDIKKFNDDFFDFIQKTKSIKDLDKIQELFFVLLYKHAKNRSIQEQIKNVIEEIGKE